MLTLLLLFPNEISPNVALDRCENLFRTHPAFSTDLVVNTGDKCSIQVRRPDRFRFELRRGAYDYVLVRSGNAALEFSPTERHYADPMVGEQVGEFESQISGLSERELPRILLQGPVRNFLKGLKVAATAGPNRETRIEGILERNPKNLVRINVSSIGEITYFEVRRDTLAGLDVLTMRFSPYRFAAPGPFTLTPPLGYEAFALPPAREPWQPPMKPAFGNWQGKDGATASVDKLLAEQTSLVVLLEPGELPSTRAAGHLPELAASLKGKAQVLLLSPAAFPNSYEGVKQFYDPSGKRFAAASLAGTPAYYLIVKGKIARLWVGDDEEKRVEIEKDIVAAATAAK